MSTSVKYPPGLVALFLVEMWERFSYYGMRAILILYLVDRVENSGLGLATADAAAIYGLYTASAYILALPGGWIADRILGLRRGILPCVVCRHEVAGSTWQWTRAIADIFWRRAA